MESYTTKWEHSITCEKVASRRLCANALSKLFFLLRQLCVWINLFSINNLSVDVEHVTRQCLYKVELTISIAQIG